MLLIIKDPVDKQTLEQVADDLDGYIKVVVDIEQGILTAGGTLHPDGEKMLLKNGSQQDHLWGGGLDLDTDEIDFDSMINIRPGQDNASREVLSKDIRLKMEELVIKLLGKH